MAGLGERGYRIKADPTKAGWEDSEFPVLCENCLGDNPYVRMTREPFGGACKVCERPFTIFRWKPGPKARFKVVVVCQMCSKLKHVCQCCMLDLQYGVFWGELGVEYPFLERSFFDFTTDPCCFRSSR